MLILTGVIILGGIGYYFYSEHQAKLEAKRLEAKRLEAKRLEQLRLDSIEAARLEAARLDSIRQDSIEFRNFSSNDLRVFELHGRVKEVIYESLGVGPITFLFNTNSFNFDEDGNLKDKKNKFDLRKPDGINLFRWNFNKNGYPLSGDFEQSGGCETQSWDWNSNGLLTKYYYSYGMHFNQYEFKYDGNGNLVSTDYTERANGGVQILGEGKVQIKETDKWGNWLTRTITETIVDEFDMWGDDAEPTPGYKIVDMGEYKIYQKKYTNKYTEKRTITYYGTH